MKTEITNQRSADIRCRGPLSTPKPKRQKPGVYNLRKPRSDAKLKTLPESRQAAIERYAAKHSLVQTVKWLRDKGLQTSRSALSNFLAPRRVQQLHSKLFSHIRSASAQCREVERAFAKYPAPAVETLIKLHRVLTFQLTKHGDADPDLLTLADKFTKTMVAAFSTQNRTALGGQNLALQERRVLLLEKKAPQAKPTGKALGDVELTEEEKAQRIREIYGRV